MGAERPRTIAVVQARLSSSRLPGKVLASIGDHTVLSLLLARLQRASTLDGIVVATSTAPDDDRLAAAAAALGVPCHRGSLADVAQRFLDAAASADADAAVRICADSPLIDPRLVDQLVGLLWLKSLDLATNVVPRTFPVGQSVEVVAVSRFAELLPRIHRADDREHVTPFLHRHLDELAHQRLVLEPPVTGSMAVDDAADLSAVDRACRLLGPRLIEEAAWAELLGVLQECR